ncbi:hypothetical protein [Litchfieldella rifensis]|uniref:Sulfotransferase n=1 Tax=Litchfieldella rifensis TaxID=762643 RepID=A0ABV7LUH0_9GAMM
MNCFLKIYGERNTNTNYLSKIIRRNLNVQELPGTVPKRIDSIQSAFPGDEFLKDVYFMFNFTRNLGWKHAKVKERKEIESAKVYKENRIFFITITKNPYSWLLSLHKRPYHQTHLKNLSFSGFIESEWKTVRRENVGRNLNSPVDLWNVKNRSYQNLDGLDVIHLTTEEIFESPEAVVDKIQNRFSLDRVSEKFMDYNKSIKEKGKDSGYYRQYYLEEKWRSKLTCNAVDKINQSLDRSLMERFGYEML